jgi:hypothetical protein
VWELSVIDDCTTDGEVGNKECERLSGVVCNPTSTAITVQYQQEGDNIMREAYKKTMKNIKHSFL